MDSEGEFSSKNHKKSRHRMALVVLRESFSCDKKKKRNCCRHFYRTSGLDKIPPFYGIRVCISQLYSMDCKFLIWCLASKEFSGFFLEMPV